MHNTTARVLTTQSCVCLQHNHARVYCPQVILGATFRMTLPQPYVCDGIRRVIVLSLRIRVSISVGFQRRSARGHAAKRLVSYPRTQTWSAPTTSAGEGWDYGDMIRDYMIRDYGITGFGMTGITGLQGHDTDPSYRSVRPGVRLAPPLARPDLAADLHLDHRNEVRSAEQANLTSCPKLHGRSGGSRSPAIDGTALSVEARFPPAGVSGPPAKSGASRSTVAFHAGQDRHYGNTIRIPHINPSALRAAFSPLARPGLPAELQDEPRGRHNRTEILCNWHHVPVIG